MKIAIRTVAWAIALLVAVQSASIAYALMSVGHLISAEGQSINQTTDVGGAGFSLHSIMGIQVIPTLAVILLVLALISRSRTTIWLSVAVVISVAIQIYLGFSGDAVPALGWIHGLLAFVIFVLAGITGQRLDAGSPTRSAAAASA